jgi:hypothetical protein
MNRQLLLLQFAFILAGPLTAEAAEHIKCGWRIDASGHEYHSCWFVN